MWKLTRRQILGRVTLFLLQHPSMMADWGRLKTLGEPELRSLLLLLCEVGVTPGESLGRLVQQAIRTPVCDPNLPPSALDAWFRQTVFKVGQGSARECWLHDLLYICNIHMTPGEKELMRHVIIQGNEWEGIASIFHGLPWFPRPPSSAHGSRNSEIANVALMLTQAVHNHLLEKRRMQNLPLNLLSCEDFYKYRRSFDSLSKSVQRAKQKLFPNS